MNIRQPSGPRRAWIVLGATFISLAMVYGIWYSYSVFLVAFLQEFGWSRSLLSGAFSIFVIVHGVLGPLNGWLAARLGPRPLILVGGCFLGVGLLLVAETTAWWHLYVAFGLIVAVGVGCAGWLPSILLVRGWFPDRVGTALGIASGGIGIGITCIVPLAQYLVDLVGWRWTYRLLAVLVVSWLVPASLWLIQDPPIPATPETERGRPAGGGAYWPLAAAIRSWLFWGLWLAFLSGNVATQMLLVHQVAYTLAFCCVVASIGTLVLAGRNPETLLHYVYAILIGLGYAATAPLAPAAASDVFGGPRFSVIFGTLHISNAIGASTGPWIAGRIFDVTGSYAAALWIALGTAVFPMGILWVVAPRHPHPPPVASHQP